MISSNITKQEFITQVLERDIRNIYQSQLLIAQQNIRVTGRELKKIKRAGPTIGVRSGSLINSLQNPDYWIQMQGENLTVSAYIVRHMRFLDMKRLGNWHIYNRQVWGILYNNALKDIRYNYGREIENRVGKALDEAFNK